MAKSAALTNERMEYLRVHGASTVRTFAFSKAAISITRSTRDTPNHGFVDQHAAEDAFMMAFQLRDYEGDLWVDGKKVEVPAFRRGNFSFYDYNRSWQANMKSEFDCVNFYIPRTAITALEEDLGTKRVETLNILPGADIDDQAVRGLAGALLPAFANPSQPSLLFVDHVGLALCTHMAVTYGGARHEKPVHPSGLAPWQLARAVEMIDAHLEGDLQIAEIAHACRLSPSYFSRAFKMTMGVPPYRWMTRRRIEKAKDLLRSTGQPLAAIAHTCGFADQSHFTRAFSKAVGISPNQWRKTIRS